MRFRTAVPVFLALALVVGLASSGFAREPASQCEDLITALAVQTGALEIVGRNAEKDRDGLLGKLDDALAKLAQGKDADAVRKLNDYQSKVQQLSDAGKIDPADAAILIADAGDAIGCILGAPAAPACQA